MSQTSEPGPGVRVLGERPSIDAPELPPNPYEFVMETEVDDLGTFEKMMAEYTSRQDVRDKMKGYADMYTTGKREVYRVV